MPCYRPQLETLEARELLSAGDLDLTFGTGGKVITDFTGNLPAFAYAVAVQPDGKMVVAGDSPQDLTVARYNADGSLDASFGIGGRVVTTIGIHGAQPDGPSVGVAVQADGKVVVVGNIEVAFNQTDFLVVRYNADGSLDGTFGTGGKVVTDFGTATVAAPSHVAVQADNKIVVVGSESSSSGGSIVALARYNADGSLDGTFGSGGKVTTSFDSTSDRGNDLVIQSDGKIVVAGSTSSSGIVKFALARYTVSGNLDPSFGTGGKSIVDFGGGGAAAALTLQADGKIVVAGISALAPPSTGNAGFAAARLNTDGNLDATFGAGGKVTTQLGASVSGGAHAVLVQPDGKIVAVGGTTTAPMFQFALVRYNPDGSLDSTFGMSGKVVTPGFGTAYGAALVAGGKIAAVGANPGQNITAPFVVARYNPDGSLDSSFGTGGKVTTVFQGTVDSQGQAVALQPDGKIVVVGGSTGTADNDFDLARYNPDGSLDVTFGAGGRIITDFGSAMDMAHGVVVQKDGRIVVVGTTMNGFAVARYNVDGSLDGTFGSSGKVITDFGNLGAGAFGVVVQADGRLVVVGTDGKDFALVRYNPDGSLDATFGTGGKVTTDFAGRMDSASGVVLQPDGKIVAVGSTSVLIGHFFSADFALARYNPDGSLDSTFGTGGTATVSSGSLRLTPGVALQADGRIVVAGSVSGGGGTFAVLRFTASGSLDSTFGTGGKVTTGFGNFDNAHAVAIQADGKIVAAGETRTIGSPTGGFALARYNPDGSLDVTFGNGGKAITTFGGLGDAAAGIVIQTDGKIVAAGTKGGNADALTPTDHTAFAVARYVGMAAGPSNQNFVAQVYLDLLQRQAEPAGLAFWTGLLNQGTSRTDVVRQIEASTEYRQKEVRQLYQQFLHRPADPFGLNAFTTLLATVATVEQVASALAGSPEYFKNQGGGTNDGFLAALYRDALNRPIDPTGQAAFSQALNAGISRGDVAAAIFGSTEYQQDLVQGWYQRFLRRAADPTGLSFFTNALHQGTRDEEVIAAIVGSPEYFSRL
jgi:uncharacterized delta-60 repeat protein